MLFTDIIAVSNSYSNIARRISILILEEEEEEMVPSLKPSSQLMAKEGATVHWLLP